MKGEQCQKQKISLDKNSYFLKPIQNRWWSWQKPNIYVGRFSMLNMQGWCQTWDKIDKISTSKRFMLDQVNPSYNCNRLDASFWFWSLSLTTTLGSVCQLWCLWRRSRTFIIMPSLMLPQHPLSVACCKVVASPTSCLLPDQSAHARWCLESKWRSSKISHHPQLTPFSSSSPHNP